VSGLTGAMFRVSGVVIVTTCSSSAEFPILKRISVLLADDHTIVRQGLRLLIEVDGDIEIVGEAKTGRRRSK